MSTNINVEFVISGNMFNTDIITEKLKLRATEQWTKGEPVVGRNIVRNDTCWSYSVKSESLDVNNQLLKIVEILNPKRNILNELKKMYELEYLMLVTINIENDVTPIISLKSSVIHFMDAIKSEFDVDLYIF